DACARRGVSRLRASWHGAIPRRFGPAGGRQRHGRQLRKVRARRGTRNWCPTVGFSWQTDGMRQAAAVGALVLLATAARAATPIPNGSATSLPAYSGAAIFPQAVKAKKPPQNPRMARNGKSNVHDDTWMSDTYWRRVGPLGRAPATVSSVLNGVCVTVTFDRRGRIVATCSSLAGPHLFMIDPATLDVLADVTLPFVPPPPGTDPTQNTAGGAYFYLDDHDEAVVATSDKHIMVFAETPDRAAPGFVVAHDYDVSATVPDDRITSVLPDWRGRFWFIGRYHG